MLPRPAKHIEKLLADKTVTTHFYRIAVSAVMLVFLILIFSIVRRSFFGQIDPEAHIYFEIVLLLLLAVLAEVAVLYFKQQSVIVLMVLGMVISPGFLKIIWNFIILLPLPLSLPAQAPVLFHHHEIIQIFAQLGAIILLFKVGIHSKIEKIFTKENLLTALAGIAVPFIVGYLYAVYSSGSFSYAMFVGASLAATSVGVTVAILKEMKV
ncbi:hypothetical protein COY95_02465, partial [Candidatus Woesearchaeota archaeon CG_4_10_14_0_8_um_filter_47_5]